MIESKPPVRQIPLWLTIPLILVCLGAGGWFLHWYWKTQVNGTASASSVYIDNPEPDTQAGTRANLRGPRGGGGGPPMADGIYDRGNRTIIRAGEYLLIAQPSVDGKTTTMSLRHNGPAPAKNNDLIVAQRLASDPATARTIGVSPAQLKQLRPLIHTPAIAASLRGGGELAMEPADLQRLQALCKAYTAAGAGAAKTAAQEQVLKAVAETGGKSMNAQNDAVAKAVAEVHKIITNDQFRAFAEFQATGTAPKLAAPPKPAAKPATRPAVTAASAAKPATRPTTQP